MSKVDYRIHPDFITLFRKKEGASLAGKKNRNFFILTGILAITFLAIGFANGSLDYLQKKMEDPFVNWININIPFEKAAQSKEILDFFMQDEQRQRFNIAHIDGYMRNRIHFKHPVSNHDLPAIYRNINVKSPIYDRIMSDDNILTGRKFTNQAHDQLGIIVSEQFLTKMDLPDTSAFLLTNRYYDNPKILIPMPVVAVVKHLPDLVDFVASDRLYRSLNPLGFSMDMFDLSKENSLSVFIHENDSTVQKLVQEINELLVHKNPDIALSEFTYSHVEGQLLKIFFYPEVKSLQEIDSLYNVIRPTLNQTAYHLRLYDYYSRWEPEGDPGRYDHIAINFDKLDKLRSFSEYLKAEFDLSIELSDLESKENYHFITRLANIVSLILIFFSILSVCLFISNLLHRHLFEIRHNLGTFKAFGLANSTLKKIYAFIIIKFLLSAIVFALLISFIFGMMGGMRSIMHISGAMVEDGQNYFHLFDAWTVIAVVLIGVISIAVLVFTANMILKKSPGDLVNDR
jgi:ABC-type antimicrobial peptide transport system permease subunit